MGYYITVEPGVQVYVEDLNENGSETILFLHGWPGDHNLFEYQFDYFSKMGYRCIGLDQRGFGLSDKPVNGYDYDRLSDDVKCVVDELKLENFTLLGHSTGGAIAIRYMAKHDGCGVSKLVLCGAAAPSLIKRSYFRYGLREETVKNIIDQTYIDRPKMLTDFARMFFYKPVSKPFSDWFLSLGLKAAGWSTAAVANTCLDEESLFLDMKKISVPTLILHGIHDKVCLFPLAEQQNKLIKNSKLVKMTNSGHGLFYDEREKFNNEVKCFIENLSNTIKTK